MKIKLNMVLLIINNSEHSTYRYNYLHVFEIKEIKQEYYNYFSYKAIDKIFSIYCKSNKYFIDNEVGIG
jgi:hypothetical protein